MLLLWRAFSETTWPINSNNLLAYNFSPTTDLELSLSGSMLISGWRNYFRILRRLPTQLVFLSTCNFEINNPNANQTTGHWIHRRPSCNCCYQHTIPQPRLRPPALEAAAPVRVRRRRLGNHPVPLSPQIGRCRRYHKELQLNMSLVFPCP